MWVKGIKNNMIDRNYTLHQHFRKKHKSIHYDLRILSISKKFVISFALPQKKIPDNKLSKVLVIRTPDHPLDTLNLKGKLKNSGDDIKILEKGKCSFVDYSESKIDIIFYGKLVQGHFIFVKLDDNSWLMISKKS